MRKRRIKILLCCFHFFCAHSKCREMTHSGYDVMGSILRNREAGHFILYNSLVRGKMEQSAVATHKLWGRPREGAGAEILSSPSDSWGEDRTFTGLSTGSMPCPSLSAQSQPWPWKTAAGSAGQGGLDGTWQLYFFLGAAILSPFKTKTVTVSLQLVEASVAASSYFSGKTEIADRDSCLLRVRRGPCSWTEAPTTSNKGEKQASRWQTFLFHL